MDARCQEEKPLQKDSFRVGDAECRRRTASGRFIPRGVIATVVALIIVLFILVIVLGSLLGKGKSGASPGVSSRDQEKKGKLTEIIYGI